MKCIAIIPARGGSKRIKNKNIKIFHKKPIIFQVISKLKKTKLFQNIYVSTDSSKIKKISEKSGAKVPFKRSKLLSNDYSSSRDVVNDMIRFLEKKEIKFDYVCCVYPTSIFISNKILSKAFKMLIKKKISLSLLNFFLKSLVSLNIFNIKKYIKLKYKNFNVGIYAASYTFRDHQVFFSSAKRIFFFNKKFINCL